LRVRICSGTTPSHLLRDEVVLNVGEFGGGGGCASSPGEGIVLNFREFNEGGGCTSSPREGDVLKFG